MLEARPSKTALRVAMHRAAHQVLDHPKVLDDPLALAIIGPKAAAELRSAETRYGEQVARNLRAFMAVRSRYAEDELAAAVARGVKQYVILGAGLDTFAYRNPYPESVLRVFEVDYPATQAWKCKQLNAAGIFIPASVTFAPVDFERETLSEGLLGARFDPAVATFFSWLGVTMYLTEVAVMSTFSFIASTPAGGGVVFDHTVSPSSLNPTARTALEAISRRVAAAGEPFRTFFEPAALSQRLRQIGFRAAADLGAEEINFRYFKDRVDGLRIGGSLGRLVSARI